VAEEPYRQDKPLVELQQAFLDLRFGMFIHFNMATFQDREWGEPTASPDLFDPTSLDTDQWARAALSAGMTWGCLTTKHHDGFCLWPTQTRSAHSRMDVVRAYVNSFRQHGLRIALYFSILDLREDIRHFNITEDKIQLIKDQLTELLTNFGEIDLLIIDGWDAPWSRITYKEVPFHEIYRLVKNLQPNCLVSDLNASGYPAAALYYTDLKAFEQNAGEHIPEGSAVAAFSCVTLTNGWFWKLADEKKLLKSANQVVQEWLIPQNEQHCNLILNAPPNREGRLAPSLVARLEEIGKLSKHPGPAKPIQAATVITTKNLATGRPIFASSSPDTIGPDLANDGDFDSSWWPADDKTAGWLEVHLEGEQEFNTLVIVSDGRIKHYRIQRFKGSVWEDLASGSDPGAVLMHEVPGTMASQVRFTFAGSARIAEIGIYNEPRAEFEQVTS
jgi:alpha-L-fucosidase